MEGRKVLVVDDEVHIVNVVAVKLRNNDYEVITAEDGQEGFDLACEHAPDIIVTDFQMPVLTGLELIEKLRANESTKDIPVIMLTARNFSIDDGKKDELMISSCLPKPFSPRELLKSIEDILFAGSVVK